MRSFVFILIIFLATSCSTKKDILLIQDSNYSVDYKPKYEEIIIKSDDILRIKVSSNSSELSSMYSFQNESAQIRLKPIRLKDIW